MVVLSQIDQLAVLHLLSITVVYDIIAICKTAVVEVLVLVNSRVVVVRE